MPKVLVQNFRVESDGTYNQDYQALRGKVRREPKGAFSDS